MTRLAATAAAIATRMLSLSGRRNAATAAGRETIAADPRGAVVEQRVGDAEHRQRAGEAEAPAERDERRQQDAGERRNLPHRPHAPAPPAALARLAGLVHGAVGHAFWKTTRLRSASR
jgi:hypothetical protein